MHEIKTFWVSGIVADEKPWSVCPYSACLSIEEAIELVWKYHVNYGLLVAWITDQNNKPMWVHSFINAIGQMESREKAPAWLPSKSNEGGDANVIPVN